MPERRPFPCVSAVGGKVQIEFFYNPIYNPITSAVRHPVFELNDEGAAQAAALFVAHKKDGGDLSVLFFDSVDYPEENGFDKGVDIRQFVGQALEQARRDLAGRSYGYPAQCLIRNLRPVGSWGWEFEIQPAIGADWISVQSKSPPTFGPLED